MNIQHSYKHFNSKGTFFMFYCTFVCFLFSINIAYSFVIYQGSVTTSEYLLQNGADVNMTDDQGRNSLHHAALLGSTGYVIAPFR